MNTYSGDTTLTAGTLQLGNGSVNGTVTSGLYQLAGGTTLFLNNSTAVQAATGGWATRVRGFGTLRLNSAQAVNGTANWGPNLATDMPFDPGFTGTLQLDNGRMDASPAGLGGITDIVINSGAQFMTWTGTYPQNFTLAGSGWGETGQPGALRVSGTANATFTGNITLTADAGLNSQGTGALMTINGNITGGFGISKENAGPLTLTGTNTYTGGTLINAGTLRFQGNASLPAASAIGLGSATLQYLDDGAGSNGTIDRTGNPITLSVASTTDTIHVGNNGSTNTGNTVAFGALNNGTAANAFASTINFTGSNGYLQSFPSLGLSGLTGNGTTLNPTTTSVTILGNVTNQESGTLTAHYDTLTLGGTSTGNAINGVISDNAGYVGPVGNGDTRVSKSGTSTWTLNGTNTYSGPTAISGGVLRITNASALGTTTSGTTQSGASALELDGTGGGVIVGAETLSINGGGITNLGTLRNIAGDNSYGGTITLAAQSRINSDSGILTLDNATAVTGVQNLVIGGAGTVLISGAIATTTGGVFKDGMGTLILSGANTYSGATTVSGGTLVISGTPTGNSAPTVNNGGTLQLDYATNDTNKINDLAILTFAGGTLDLKGGSQTEIVASTTLTAGTASRVTSSTPGSVLQMNTITAGAGASIDFGAAGIATTDNANNSLGILGTWATIGGTDFAVNSTNLGDGPITAYTGYTDVPRLNPGIIADASGFVRIIEGSGAPGSITLSSAITTINMLNQSAVGGASPAMIDPAGQTLLTNGILVGTGAGALTIGTGTNNGTLGAATAGGDLTLLNTTANNLTLNSVIADNASPSTLTKTGTGPATLTGANTYTGGTILTLGTLQLGSAGALGTGPLTLNGGILDSTVANLVNANNNPQAWNGNFSFLGTQALNLGTGAVTTNGARTVTVSANTLTVGGSFTPSATAGSHLTKLGTGTLVLNGATALGNNGIAVNGGTVRFGGTLTTSSAVAGAGVNTFKVGNLPNASAAFVQTGGSIILSVNDVDGMNLGNADSASGAFGSLTIQGGTFSAPRFNVGGSGVNPGTNGVGLLNVLSGGSATLTAYMIGSRGATNTGATTIAGGTLDLSGVAMVSGHIGTYGGGRQEYNLGANLGGSNTGGLVTTGANPFSVVAQTNTGIGIANLLGGTLLTNAFASPAGTSTGVGINQFNFNGGTLKHSGTAGNANFFLAIAAGVAPGSGVFVRSGGATIDNGQAVTIAAALLAPTGGEVTSITASGATGFITAPYVKIVGGNNDATAIAQIDDSGTLTNILVTNPGTGYATAPTVTLVGGTTAGGTNITTGTATATVGASTSGGLTKNGAGFLTLSGANTYTGVTTINAGSITANSLNPSTSFVVNSGGQLYGGWQIPGAIFTNTLTLSGTGYLEGGINNGALRASNNQTFSGPTTLAADSRISMIEATGACTFSGQITGGFALDVQGSFTGNAGTQTFTLANTGTASDYSGNTSISAADFGAARTGVTTILRLGASDQLPNGTDKGNVVFNGADANHLTILELNGFNETINGLSNTAAASAIIRNTTTGTSVLTIGDADTTSTFSGAITNSTGTLAITKIGTGSLTLSGANTYGGNTTVNAGTLTLSNATDPLNANPGNDASTVAIAATGATLDLTYTGTDKVGKLVIGTTQLAAGVYGRTGSVLPVIGIAEITGDGTLTVGAFSSWITGTFANGAVPLGQRGPNNDPDNDGLNNLLEYAIAGQDPTVGNAAGGSFTANTLSFTKRADTTGLTYAIVESTDVGVTVPWTEVPAGPSYTNNATTISYTLTPGTPVKNFIRLRVIAAP
jgi:autotransporter-associated beta strand protein